MGRCTLLNHGHFDVLEDNIVHPKKESTGGFKRPSVLYSRFFTSLRSVSFTVEPVYKNLSLMLHIARKIERHKNSEIRQSDVNNPRYLVYEIDYDSYTVEPYSSFFSKSGLNYIVTFVETVFITR